MNSTANDNKKTAPTRLLPHQAALVDLFFSPSSKRALVLRADVGLGKSTALIAVASRFLREQPSARVLCLVPAPALQEQFVQILRQQGAPASEMDRYRFRELLDSAAGEELWPAGVVIVMTRQFARQEDIRKFLTSTRWHLLLVDEVHQFKAGLGRDVLRQLGEFSDRVILSALPGLELPDAFSEENTTVVAWQRDQIVDHLGKPLNDAPRPTLHEVHYNLSSAELSMAEAVAELYQLLLRSGTRQNAFVATSWLRSLQSSPAALEAKLQKLKDVETLMNDLEDTELEGQVEHWLDAETAEITRRLTVGIEELASDSKLGAFATLLNQVAKSAQSSRMICAVTDYVATLFYIAEEIETQGTRCQLLHGSMNYEDRQTSIEQFRSTGGVLMATSAVLSGGIAIPDVTDLVLYDVPDSVNALQRILGSFDRFGRKTQLNIYAFMPSREPIGATSLSIQLLRQVLGAARVEEGR